MTDLYDQDAPDDEDLVTCWLQPVMRTAVEHDLGGELPFCEVTRIDGADDPDCGTDDPVIQLDFYAEGAKAAKDASKLGHRRMLYLIHNCPIVTLSDGVAVSVDFGEPLIKAFRMPFEHDRIVRYTARYKLGTSYVTVD